MNAIGWILVIIGGLLVILITVVLIRAISFRPQKKATVASKPVQVPLDQVVNSLQELIQCKTISYQNEAEEDMLEFLKFEAKLQKHFPQVHNTCEFAKLGNRSLLFKWIGKQSTKTPAVLMSHYDVVPVVEELWNVPPFSGLIQDGYLWGRGTLDTKGTLNGIMSAAELLITQGFVPEQDVYFAFAGNEEVAGTGAIAIVDYFERMGIEPRLVVDEGGAVVNNVFPGVKNECALIGIAEKGMMAVELILKSSGGHASSPKPHTVVGELAQAAVNVEANPFKSRLSIPAKLMFDTLGRESSIVYRMIFANLWLFRGLLDAICKKSGGELNALMRTTMALTQMEGSRANNVIPPVAKMGINSRLICGESSEEAIAQLKKVIANDRIEVRKVQASEPSRISQVDCPAYDLLTEVIRETWDQVLVSPYLMIACSDSRHYGRISPYVYRFSAMRLSLEERKSIHGNNEKIPLETIQKTVEFYLRLMQRL